MINNKQILNNHLPAALFSRLIAGLIDIIFFAILYAILVLASLFVIGFVGGGIFRLVKPTIAYQNYLDVTSYVTDMIINSSIFYLVLFLISILIFSIFEYSQGKSPGKRLFNINIIKIDEKNLKLEHITLRNLFKCLSILFIGMGYISCFLNSRRQALHDKVMNTMIIRYISNEHGRETK
ncbi:RDD family protein [Propionispora hippei]|uniref:Uncharacterized membrane protein YckC, RDD family n=1 Tax=Propionispora hippei DSM 15287 TaxID=1123003 RepID=A0A1M6KNL0_9FIRM|nr:RDD family protein [Propionispora hippei]SHJ60464.1 Uncharacterized membrane protein YckC, RDD family [Propionispora hippei DSM 15287]